MLPGCSCPERELSKPFPAIDGDLRFPSDAKQMGRNRKLWDVPTRNAGTHGFPERYSCPRLGTELREAYNDSVSSMCLIEKLLLKKSTILATA